MTLSEMESMLKVELARDDVSESQRIAWLNEAQGLICREDAFAFLRASSTLETETDTRIVALPTGCGTIQRIEYDGKPVVEANRDHLMRMYGLTDKGEPQHYERTNSNIGIFPHPDAVYSLFIRHLKIFTNLSASGDSNALTSAWGELVVYQAKIIGAESNEDTYLAGIAESQYQRQLRAATKSEVRRDYEPLDQMSWSPDVLPDKSWRV